MYQSTTVCVKGTGDMVNEPPLKSDRNNTIIGNCSIVLNVLETRVFLIST
jgi:hypothetical protein